MTRLRYFSYATLFISLCGLSAYAQTSAGSSGQPTTTKTQSQPIKKQVINFEDELIEGSAEKPELFYLFQKRNFNYKRLIRLRENFLPEMRQSAEDIKRLRGGR